MTRHNASRAPLLAGLIASIVALPALSQTQAGVNQQQSAPAQASLGQSWPQAQNLSVAPGWRVYVFVLNGVKYIQVNDLVGRVHTAIATENGSFLVLPLGVDAQRVSTPAQPLPAALNSTAPAITVYQDNAVQLVVRYQSDGSTVWTASAQKKPKAMAPPPPAPAAQTFNSCPPCGGPIMQSNSN